LDVADIFKVKYLEQSKKLSMGFLLNALNLLNDADERYKSSRNPRLHIELTLIKLCHINQFISEIPTLEEVKKKLGNLTSKAVKKNTVTEKGSVIADKITTPSIKEDVKSKVSSTRLGILDRDAFLKQHRQGNNPAEANSKKPEEIKQPNPGGVEIEAKSAEVRNLQPVIQYTADSIRLSLSESFGNLLNSVFKSIQSKIENDTLIFVISNKIHEGFLEEEKPLILQKIKSLTQNQITSFRFEFEPTMETTRRPYTDREKLDFLIEKHPLLNEVMEKLKLRLP